MTEWEKKWMSDAPQDCLRAFRLNPNATGGFSEYGETMANFESTETLTEDNGKAQISLLKVDAVAPLSSGTFLRTYLFGSITDGVPVWETDGNGEPVNYRNYYITEGNSRWFEYHPTGHVNRYKHDYVCEEVIACLKDYPIRSIKTFAEGAYTFGECLNIAFELAFRPRSVGNYKYVIKPFPGLDEPNSKLEYSNSTLYDVVSDVGRIIDAVPNMEITFADGVYTFELSFIDRYGLEGEVHDISYFNMKLNDAINTERGTSAGTSISNVQNLITGGNSTPYVAPNTTNESNDWNKYKLPYPIDIVKEIRFWWEPRLERRRPQDTGLSTYQDVIILTSGERTQLRWAGNLTGFVQQGLENRQTVLTQEKEIDLFATNALKDPAKVFLASDEEWQYLAPTGSLTAKCKDNTVHYARGGTEVNISAIINKQIRWLEIINSGVHANDYIYFRFSTSPRNYDAITTQPLYYDFPWTVSITYSAMINGVIKGINSKKSDVTVFFNQQGQVVDIESFGTGVTNYTKSMYGESRVVCHVYDKIGRREMYAEMPQVGSSVIDDERGKRYVVTGYSFTRRMNGGLYIAELGESRAGKSRYIIADNQQRCYAIPDNNVVDSMSHTHIICKMGVQSPFEGEGNNAVIEKPYLFNAFIGATHGKETQPSNVGLSITTSQSQIDTQVGVYFSRIRLSALLTFRMFNNSVIRIENRTAQLYTDKNGQLQSIHFQYKTDTDTAISFSQVLDKDAYEILNHTTQTSWVEYGNLRIHENLIDLSYFGNGEGLNEPLQLVLLSSRMRLNDNLAEHTVARYNVSYQDTGNTLMFTANGLATIPQHVGWAIARGNKVILLDNFDTLTDNIVKVFYQVEVRD